LIAYASVEIANNQLDIASATLEACAPDAPPWECLLQLAKCQLALAKQDIAKAEEHAKAALEVAHTLKLGRYLPEALFYMGKCQFLHGDFTRAKLNFEQARVEATKLGSRRLLWQIISYQADLEPDKTTGSQLRSQAGEIVAFITDHTSSQDLKQSFLQLSKVAVR
jgi:hypothetical protein